jgi:hypothetical protein
LDPEVLEIWIGLDRVELELQELQWIYLILEVVKLEKGITKHPLFSKQ